MRGFCGKILWAFCLQTGLCFCVQVTSAQNTTLEELAITYHEEFHKKKAYALEFAKEKGIPVRFKNASGTLYELQYISAGGLPVYYKTFNSSAAGTTRTEQLYGDGPLGLNITGKGMTIGVWDGGRVKQHEEFTGRLFPADGATENDGHAIHVTGTLIAGGVNINARGMAYEANARTFDWNNDISEMTTHAGDVLVSNHSYGIAIGWENNDGDWGWNGPADENEDFKFGYYSSKSKSIDNLAFNAPFYTIVWAAGNDRSDVGDGTRPADGPFDTIGPEGIAKNVVTVGAVEKVSDYTGPGDVVMSSFSSWGPSDDGRIKPDLVAQGVGVFSTDINIDGEDAYSNRSGTSMASPNVAGSLLLLQQLYSQLNHGAFMKSATLKGLAIHTADEAGGFDGPDYQFGWGLLNTVTAATTILNRYDGGVILGEYSLIDGNEMEIEIVSDGISPIEATICWTDPSGTVPAASIDPSDLLLVNDLDIRIFDENNTEYMPWVLNPSKPVEPAVPSDNFRDNVEKIKIIDPQPGTYTIVISHKETLSGGSQPFSLITTYSSEQSNKNTFYWIGNSGNWNDPANWSDTSGGSAINTVPTANDVVIFDENSFSANDQSVLIDSDVSCFSLKWLSFQEGKLNLGSNTLSVDGSLLSGMENFVIDGNGTIRFRGLQNHKFVVNLSGMTAANLTLLFDGEGTTWDFQSPSTVNRIELVAGRLEILNRNISVNEILVNSDANKQLILTGSTIDNLKELDLTGLNSDFDFAGSTINVDYGDPVAGTFVNISTDQDVEFGNLNVFGGVTIINGNQTFVDITNAGFLQLNGSNTVSSLVVKPGSELVLNQNQIQTIIDNIEALGEMENRISIKSSTEQNTTINFNQHQKVCFDYIDVENVAVTGQAVFNAGASGTVNEKSIGWQQKVCEDVLFADFEVNYNCENAITRFSDLSTGNISSRTWDFGDSGSGNNSSNEANPYHVYTSQRNFDVNLTISDGETEINHTQVIQVGTNNMREPEIVLNGNQLASTVSADTYQWLVDGDSVAGATERTFIISDFAGSFQVLVSNGVCNRVSPALLVTGIEDDRFRSSAKVFPNPVHNKLNINIINDQLGNVEIILFDLVGRLVYQKDFKKKNQYLNQVLDLSFLDNGVYIIRASINGRSFNDYLIKK